MISYTLRYEYKVDPNTLRYEYKEGKENKRNCLIVQNQVWYLRPPHGWGNMTTNFIFLSSVMKNNHIIIKLAANVNKAS